MCIQTISKDELVAAGDYANVITLDANDLALAAFACEERAGALDGSPAIGAQEIARRNREIAAQLSDLANERRVVVVMANGQG